jgi:septal ring factor EnvC (AmiA/AmiB activator)
MNWDKIRDVITVLLIPSLLWVFSISRTIEGERIRGETAHAQLIELRTKVERLQERDQATSLQLVRLETRLDGLRGQLDRIETMLEKIIQSNAASAANAAKKAPVIP